VSSLFRPESLNARRDRLSGAVALRQPVRYGLLAIGITGVVIALILFLLFGQYARRQMAVGYIVPTSGVVKLYPRQNGILEALGAVEGAQVATGTVLARISSRRELAGERDTDAQLAAQLRLSVTQAERKIDDELRLAGLEGERLAQQIEAVAADITRLESLLSSGREKLALIESRKTDFERLRSKGFVSDAQYQDQYQSWLEAKSRVEDLHRSLASQQAQQRDLQLQREQLPGRQSSRLADLHRERSELQQRLIEVESRRELAVVAPVSGRVTAIQAKPGQAVTPQLPLLTILPDGAEFEAELFVPSRAIGFVREAQTVFLRYQAFPHQRYGLYEGRVRQVASAILSPQEIGAALPLPNEPVYRVTVALNAQQVSAYGRQFPLQAGMLLEADIVLDRRPIWQWLLEPVLSLRGRI
jgi:membrane fusion protein